jgi:phage terminase small subunit
MPRPLNPKQLKFVERYLATGNATQSYIEAGYTKDPEAAKANAARLLTKDNVKQAVDAARAKALEKHPLTYEAALNNMWEQARWYGPDASHMARVKATEKVMEHFRPPAPLAQPGGVTVNVANLSADELRRRIDEVRSRITVLSNGTGETGLPVVAQSPPPGNDVDVAAPH